MFEWHIETKLQAYSQLALLAFVYRFLFKPKGYREFSHHRFFKKGAKLYYQVDNATSWIIDLSDFSHFAIFGGESNFSETYEVLIHTKSHDVYSMECALSENDYSKMVNVVTNEWCNTQWQRSG